MVGPGALKPKVGDGIKSRRPLSAPVLHSFILLFFFFVLCLLLHLYWCVYNNNNKIKGERSSLDIFQDRTVAMFLRCSGSLFPFKCVLISGEVRS